jgi:TM2 domain-containing membrane protein YozV
LPKFCPNCGANLPNPEIKFCNECGTQINYLSPVDSKKPDQVHSEEKSPWVATICSFFIPGLGQVYNGETAKGIAVFFGTLIGFFIYFIPGLLVWLFGLYDAYTTAKKMNAGEIPFRPTKTAHMILFFILVIIL